MSGRLLIAVVATASDHDHEHASVPFVAATRAQWLLAQRPTWFRRDLRSLAACGKPIWVKGSAFAVAGTWKQRHAETVPESNSVRRSAFRHNRPI